MPLDNNSLAPANYDGQPLSFIVRITCEQLDEHGRVALWRGSVERVGVNQRLYFQDLESIKRFIQEECRLQKGPLPWWRELWIRMRDGF